jgi:LDH2 family malate/lactate/ureidoglycolate dehydrogenase
MVFDVAAFTTLETFTSRLQRLLTNIKQVSVRDGFDNDEIYIPGEQSAQTEKQRTENGIPVQPGVWAELESLAETYDVSLLESEQ